MEGHEYARMHLKVAKTEIIGHFIFSLPALA